MMSGETTPRRFEYKDAPSTKLINEFITKVEDNAPLAHAREGDNSLLFDVNNRVVTEIMRDVYENVSSTAIDVVHFEIAPYQTSLVIQFDGGDHARYTLREGMPGADPEATLSYMYKDEVSAPSERKKDMSVDDMAVVVRTFDRIKSNPQDE